MRIAVVQAGLGAGGTERVVSMLAWNWCHRGDEVHVLTFAPEGTPSYFPFPPEATLHSLESRASVEGKGGWLRSAHRLLPLRARLRAIRPHVVVSFLTKTNVLTLLATRGLGVPVVISERNNPHLQKMHPLWRLLARLTDGFAARLVMQTEAIRATVPPRLLTRVSVIPNPCRLPVGTRRAVGSETVVAVGRLVDQKGFDLLIEAFALISRHHPGWRLVIYGDGPERPRLEALARHLGIEDRVALAGITSRPGAWTEAAEIFVLSSRYEGFPNVLIEAMAAGLPVIACACPWGPGEIIAHGVNGLLVAANAPEELARALDRLIADAPLRSRLARAAPQAVERFAVEHVAGAWNDMLADVLASDPGVGRRTSRAVVAAGILEAGSRPDPAGSPIPGSDAAGSPPSGNGWEFRRFIKLMLSIFLP